MTMHTRKRGGLDYRQDIFVKEMLKEKNPRLRDHAYQIQCAEIAGYKGFHRKLEEGEHQLDNVVTRLMSNPRVLATLAGHKMEDLLVKEYGPDHIKSRLVKLAQANIADYIEWSTDGVKVLPSSKLSREQTANIVKVTQRTSRYGQDITVEIERPLDAVKELARIQGMYKDNLAVKDPIDEALEKMTTEDLKAALSEVLGQNPELSKVIQSILPQM